MPRRKCKVDENEFDKDFIEKKLATEKDIKQNSQKVVQKIQQQEAFTDLSASNAIGVAFMKSGNVKLTKLAISILLDAGHLGMDFLNIAINFVFKNKRDENECKLINNVCELLLPHLEYLKKEWPCTEHVLLVPPVPTCNNGHELKMSKSKPTIAEVTVYTLTKKMKLHSAYLICRKCQESYKHWSIDSHKRRANGKRTYYAWDKVAFVAANEKVFIDKEMCERYACLLSHCWTTYQGFSEAYTETLRNLDDYNKLIISDKKDEELWALDRRTLRDGYFEYEIFHQLLNSGKNERSLFINDMSSFVKQAGCSEGGYYEHVWTDKCTSVGCDKMSIGDGCWKISYALCMYQSKASGPIPGVNYPVNCKNGPRLGKAFCDEHCELMSKSGWPTKLSEFVETIRKTSGRLVDIISAKQQTDEDQAEQSDVSSYSDDEEVDIDVSSKKGKVKQASHYGGRITRSKKKFLETENAAEAIQSELMKSAPQIEDSTIGGRLRRKVDMNKKDGNATCTKNTGRKRKLHMYTRGHFATVAPCGWIYSWDPLIGSESPSQAFVLIMKHLKNVLKDIPVDDWHKYTYLYDNICHVDDMHAARKPLPTKDLDGLVLFEKPFNEAWIKINKAIDKLHLSNHKNPKCKKNYNPETIQEMHPEIKINTMCGEQTFVWLSRYHKHLGAMDKESHHFALHRLIYRHNRNTTWKNSIGKPLDLPKVYSKYTT